MGDLLNVSPVEYVFGPARVKQGEHALAGGKEQGGGVGDFSISLRLLHNALVALGPDAGHQAATAKVPGASSSSSF